MASQVSRSAHLAPKVGLILTIEAIQQARRSGHREAGTMDVDPLVVHALEKLSFESTRHVLAPP